MIHLTSYTLRGPKERFESVRRNVILTLPKGYKGLQRATKGYKGLQRATKGYKGLQKATKGYKRLQRATGSDRRKIRICQAHL